MAMAKRKSRAKVKKKGGVIKFELSLSGLLGVGVVCFCIFLWMFLLGVWSGEKLFPSGKYRALEISAVEAKPVALKGAIKKRVDPARKAVNSPAGVDFGKKQLITEAVKKKPVAKQKGQSESGSDPEEDPAFFAVQVGAYKDSKLAGREVENWNSKGYRSFSRSPEGKGDVFTRVYVGRFDSMDSAKEVALDIGAQGKNKPFVVLIPGE